MVQVESKYEPSRIIIERYAKIFVERTLQDPLLIEGIKKKYLLRKQPVNPYEALRGIISFYPEEGWVFQSLTEKFGVRVSNDGLYPIFSKIRTILQLPPDEYLSPDDPRVVTLLQEAEEILGITTLDDEDLQALIDHYLIFTHAPPYIKRAVEATLKNLKDPYSKRSEQAVFQKYLELIFGNLPPGLIIWSGNNRKDVLGPMTRILDEAGINEPLFPSKKGERIPFRIAEGPLNFPETNRYEQRHQAKNFILEIICKLYQEAITSQDASVLSKMVKFLVEYKLPEDYPLPVSPSEEYGNSSMELLGLYRSDIVLYEKGQEIRWMVVEDDASPGGLAISTALLIAFNSQGPVDKLIEVIKQNSQEYPPVLTILRSGRVFPRPEHEMIKAMLEENGVSVHILNIEDIEKEEDIPPGWVFFYGLPAHLFPTEEAMLYELLSSPEKIKNLMGLNLSPEEITNIKSQIQRMERSFLTSFKESLTPFTNLAISGMLDIYNFSDAQKSTIEQRAEELLERRKTIAKFLLESDSNGHLRFINRLYGLRLTHTKIADVIPFLPGFKEYLEKEARNQGFPLEVIETFYETTPFGFLAIGENTGIPELDEFTRQWLEEVIKNPSEWVAKASDCPLGLLNWGSRSLIGAIRKDGLLDSEIIEKIRQLPFPFIFQLYIKPLTENTKLQIGYFFTNRTTVYPPEVVLRLSPYAVVGTPSNGLYTGETITSETKELSSHGGSSSFFGPLIL